MPSAGTYCEDLNTDLFEQVIDFEVHFKDGFVPAFVMQCNDEGPWTRGRDIEVNIRASVTRVRSTFLLLWLSMYATYYRAHYSQR